MSRYENVRFARIGYAAVFDSQRKCFSGNGNDYIMKHLEKQTGIAAAMKISLEKPASFEHRFSYRKIRYRATFTPFYEHFFLCRVYPEDCYMKCAYSELYKYISDMRCNSAEMICAINRLKNESLPDIQDKAAELYTSELLALAEKEYSCAAEVLKMFDKQHIVEYVPIIMYLDKTNERIRKNNSIIGKEVTLDINITQSVARVNYVLFEAALSSVARLFYKILQPGESAVLKITGKDNGALLVRADCVSGKTFDERESALDISLLKCMFDALDSTLKVRTAGNAISLRAEVPASLSNYFNRVKDIYADIADITKDEFPDNDELILYPDKNIHKPYEFRSRRAQYREDMLELIWDIAMRSLYDGITA